MENNYIQNADKKDTHEIHTNNKTFFQTFIEGNLLQIITLIIGAVMAVVVGYFSISIFPLMQTIDALRIQVLANTEGVARQEGNTERLIRLEERLLNVQDNVVEMKLDIKNLLRK